MRNLAVASLWLLSACATSNNGFCPVPIYPGKEFIDWYEATPTPRAVDDYLDKVIRQQAIIELNCK